MRADSLDVNGELIVERLSSLPTWDPSYIGRLIFNTADDTLYIGKSSGFAPAGSADGFGGLDWTPTSSNLEVVTKDRLRMSIKRHGGGSETKVYWTVSGLDLAIPGSGSATSLDMDDTGNIIYAGGSSGVYISINGGTTFTACTPTVTGSGGFLVACNNDGSTVYALYTELGSQCKLYYSTNYGQSWTLKWTFTGNALPHDIACDSAADTVIVCTRTFYIGGRIYLSKDGGTTFAETRPAGNVDRSWWFVDCSDDGEFLMAGVYGGGTGSYTGGRIYISLNCGDTWSEVRPSGDTSYYWEDGCCNSDGSVLVVHKYGNSYISTNGGSSWTPSAAVAENVNFISCSETGQYIIIAGNDYDYCRVSNDYGASWNTQVFKTSSKNWYGVKVLRDASKFYAMAQSGILYIGNYETRTGTPMIRITAYDLISSIRGGVPPYLYAIKRVGSVYAGNYSDPTDAYTSISCSEISSGYFQVVIKVTDSTSYQSESKVTVYALDLDGNCPV